MSNQTKFKKGAASFYIVAFSTLILIIIATSFATIMISEITRTSNDDLSQSAYDSALAGVEDAKVAFYNYKNCQKNGGGNCDLIIGLMESENPPCNMVGTILGRAEDSENGGIIIQESISGNNMQQAYTCVKIITSLSNYLGTLSSSQQMKAVRVKFDSYKDENGVEHQVPTDMIKKIKISWFSDTNDANFKFTNFNDDKVEFPSLSSGMSATATPPTISLALIQTSNEFNLDSFDHRVGEETNRGMVYLVPTNNQNAAKKSKDYNYIGAYNGTENKIDQNGFLKSNDKTTRNLPYAVYCGQNTGNDFACSATIDIPKPIGGTRNDETFTFVVALPYGKPTTDFSLEFFCNDGEICMRKDIAEDEEETIIAESNQAYLKGVQIEVDSNGRANDLFRRIQARLEVADDATLSIMGPLELLGTGSDSEPSLGKNWTVTKEYNFR